MNKDQTRIWKYLSVNALGMINAKHIAYIACALNILPNGTNNDNIRKWIKEMVMYHGKQIGTCSNGAFVILDIKELEAAASYVERENRADAVQKNGDYNP